MQKPWMRIVWPAFIAACAMEMLVFGLFDPHDLRWFGQDLEISAEAAYTLAFFAFWAVTGASSWLTVTLGLSTEEVNQLHPGA